MSLFFLSLLGLPRLPGPLPPRLPGPPPRLPGPPPLRLSPCTAVLSLPRTHTSQLCRQDTLLPIFHDPGENTGSL